MPRATKGATPKRSVARKNGESASPGVPPVSVTHDDIARRAYELFEQGGAQHGRDLDHWLDAERQLNDR